MHLEESSLSAYAMQDGSVRMRCVSNLLFCFLVVLQNVYCRNFYSCCRHGFSSNNLYQESVTAIQWYSIFLSFTCFSFLSWRFNQVTNLDPFRCLPLYSKYAIGTWNWRIRYWMEARLLVWRFVILVTLRYWNPISSCFYCCVVLLLIHDT